MYTVDGCTNWRELNYVIFPQFYNLIRFRLTPNRQHRLRLDAVVALSERPGFPGQLLIGYSSGLSLIYDLRADRVVVLLPWKHGLEAATWCGGNGLPHRTSSTATPIHLGTRLLTAHSDGSLGVWSLRDAGFSGVTSSPAGEPPMLNMEDPPTRPYGNLLFCFILMFHVVSM